MAEWMMPKEHDHAECVVCWSETEDRCSPCGDPVCGNCRCPNGCEHTLDQPVRRLPRMLIDAPFAA